MRKTACLSFILLLFTACNPFGCGEREERYFVAIRGLREESRRSLSTENCPRALTGIESDDFACNQSRSTTLGLRKQRYDKSSGLSTVYTCGENIIG
jgi:hypothetical protein